MPFRTTRAENPAGLSAEEIREIGLAYLEGEDRSRSREVREMARAQAANVEREFRALTDQIRVEFTDRDPYASYEELAADVVGNRHMWVYTEHSDTPLWEPKINWMARAVHDYDHVLSEADFSVPGEIAAYQFTAGKAPGLAPLALSEIALQASSTAVLGGFAAGPQKVVIPSERVTRLVERARRPNPASETRAEHVHDIAAALDYLSPDDVAALYAAAGVPKDQAVAEIGAALLLRSGKVAPAGGERASAGRGSGKVRRMHGFRPNPAPAAPTAAEQLRSSPPEVAGVLAALVLPRGNVPAGRKPPPAFLHAPFSFEHEGKVFDGATSGPAGLVVQTDAAHYAAGGLPIAKLVQNFIAAAPGARYVGTAQELREAALHAQRTWRVRLVLRAEDGGAPEILLDPALVLLAAKLASGKIEIGWGPDPAGPVYFQPLGEPWWRGYVMPLARGAVEAKIASGAIAPERAFPKLVCTKRRG